MRVRQRRGEFAARVLLADRRFAREIEAILLAEAGKIMVVQQGASEIEYVARRNVGYVPKPGGLVR